MNLRKVEMKISISKQIINTILIIVIGLILGIFQKWLDANGNEVLPLFLQNIDLVNYFGRLAIWILLATILSVYASTPIRASINTFSFLMSMLVGYYCYSYFILGFADRFYIMVWLIISFLSIFIAYLCWYSKGDGVVGMILTSGILGLLLAQAISLTQGFAIYHIEEVITWIIGVVVLARKPKEYPIIILVMVLLAYFYQLFIPYYG